MSREMPRKPILLAGLCLGVLVLPYVLPTDQLTSSLRLWIEELGYWGPLAFAVVYIVATVCLVPGSLLTLLGGAMFGLLVGCITISIASTLGAALAFLIARYLARAKVEYMAQANEKFAAVDEAISEGGWKVVALLRLSPAIPFNLQNYLLGLTEIRFLPYVLTSWIAMIPGTILYVYLGHAAGATASGRERTTAEWLLLSVGLLATIVVTVYVTRLARDKLDA